MMYFQADFIDHYNNLTLKTFFTLKYFLNVSNFQQPPWAPPKYLVKADDDSYLNLPALRRTLFEVQDEQPLLMGSRFEGAKPRHQAETRDKWWCPRYMYNGDAYPPMLSGSGYVMSRSAAACLYMEGLKLPFFHLEDVLVTGFAAEACGIERRHHKGFRHLPVKLHKIKATDIMLHYRSLKGKAELYNSRILK